MSYVWPIRETIQAYFDAEFGEHARERSWEHCYGHFHKRTSSEILDDLDGAALQLGFYLASWGMYRGSGFLLHYTYTIHRDVIERLMAEPFSILRTSEFGSSLDDGVLSETILEACRAIRLAYQPFAREAGSENASDTLVSKVLLGVFSCVPASDRFFCDGFRESGFRFQRLDGSFIEAVREFCHGEENFNELRALQSQNPRVHYPLMKLVDIYFWRVGYLLDQARRNAAATNP